MTYEEIYSLFYTMIDDPTFFKLPEDQAYDMMRKWLHKAGGTPYIKKLFSAISFDDELMEITYELKNSIDEESDNNFVINIFAQYMVIAWMQPQVDSLKNMAVVLGTKEEKRIQSNYKTTIARSDSLKISLRKMIRDYGYENNDYISEET